jgi:hypothetical protein
MKRYFSFAVLITIIFLSCTKESVYEKDISKPEIEVVYPNDKPVINTGDPLCIKVQISDDKSLVSVWLQVNDGQGFKKDYPITGRSIEIIEKYYTPGGIKGQLTAKFFATDEAGNTGTAEILFSTGK